MRYIFIVNPVAGKGKAVIKLIPKIKSYFQKNGGAYEIVMTSAKGDATRIAYEQAKTGAEVRLYACGGDGTLFEVVNGAFGWPNVEVGAFPYGTGNDYILNFAAKDDFLNIDGQVKGSSVPVDLIKAGELYGINQCSMGFDAKVVVNVDRFRRMPILGGKFAYTAALLYTLIGDIQNRITIKIDDDEPISGSYLFAIAAKGCYHGGGYKSAPSAEPNNGVLACVLIKAVSKLRFLTLLSKYKRGEHEKFKKIVTAEYGRSMELTTALPLPITIDGEIIFSDHIRFEIVPDAMKFIIPSVCTVKGKNNAFEAGAAQDRKAPTACEAKAK